MVFTTLVETTIIGIVTFIREWKENYLWRWIYVFGGIYVLFDLFAIAIGLEVWQILLGAMFDIKSPYWNIVWGFFILLGAAVFALGIGLMLRMKKR